MRASSHADCLADDLIAQRRLFGEERVGEPLREAFRLWRA